MTDCNPSSGSHSPHSSLSTPTPISIVIPHEAPKGSNTTGKQVAFVDSSKTVQDGGSSQNSDVGTPTRNVVLQTPRANPSHSLARTRRRNNAGAPKVSGAARPSRSSRAAVGSSDVSSLPNEKTKHDIGGDTNPDSHSSSPDSHGLPVANPHTPLPPYRAKARRSTTEGSSVASMMPNASSLASPTPQIGGADAHVNLEIGECPAVEEEPGLGAEGHSTDSTKTGSESSVAGTEAESLASSIYAEPGNSVPEKLVSSECSNSVELCVDSQDTAMIAQTSDDTQHFKPTSQSVSQQVHASSVLIPGPSSTVSLKQPASVSSRPVSHIKDDTGWVTDQQSTDKPSEARSNPRPDVISREHGALIDSERASQPINSSEARTSTANATAQGKEAPWLLQSTPKGLQILHGPHDQTMRSPHLTNELKLTSADFVPRTTVEFKPAPVEFKPTSMHSQIGFVSDPSLADRHLGDVAHLNDTFKSPGSVATSQGTSNQYSRQFHSEPATALNEYQSYPGTGGRSDDAVYHDNHVLRSDNHRPSHSSSNDYMAADEQFNQVDDSQSDQPFDDSHKTPNVYINGLPPHFPEDQLYALTASFGEVKSVRTFTRHVKDSESGYGFVLFDTIEAAERCILELRKYRNIHPTFSKQIHKIPGTVYAHAQSNSESTSSLSSWDPRQDEKESFKRRMESLQDPTSTNLYMEGLPLSIDEATLAALVAPHRISSSRLFQTKLSNPPRIIAFVRLETRAGAEEVIERLHGRMVRGWNDSGSRISVRFADTAEQRELRRAERVANEGDNTTSKLTIAQAALLNRFGPELRQMSHTNNIPVIGEHRRPSPASYTQDEFYLNPLQIPNPQMTRPFEVDYSLTSGRSAVAQRSESSAGDFNQNVIPQFPRPIPRNVDPSAAILLNPLHSNEALFRGTNPASRDPYTQQQALAMHNNQRHMSNPVRPSPAHARAGYTPVEELIMRVHAESARSHAAPVDLATYGGHRNHSEAEAIDMATGVRAYCKPTATTALGQYTRSPFTGHVLPTGENEFHNNAARPRREPAAADHDSDATVNMRSQGFMARRNDSQDAHVNHRNVRDSNLQHDYTSASFQHRFDPSVSSVVNDQCLRQHVRCTTFPNRPTSGSTSGNQHQRHQQHSSMSLPSVSRRTPQHASMAVMGQPQFQQSPGASASLTCQTYESENNSTSPLISPALTYSSQTPSTLSPATHFFGSFNSQNEGFERLGGFEREKGKSVAS